MEKFEIIISLCTLLLAFLGSIGAVYQWYQGNKMKRIQIINELIETIRGDESVSSVVDIIDWGVKFYYNGKFHLGESQHKALTNLSDDDFFQMIDKTLSRFAYICYLKEEKILKEEDMSFFQYKLKRLYDNNHICNYLYSLYHWSKSIGTQSSYVYLVRYGLENKLLSSSFLSQNSDDYMCYLQLNHSEKEYTVI